MWTTVDRGGVSDTCKSDKCGGGVSDTCPHMQNILRAFMCHTIWTFVDGGGVFQTDDVGVGQGGWSKKFLFGRMSLMDAP